MQTRVAISLSMKLILKRQRSRDYKTWQRVNGRIRNPSRIKFQTFIQTTLVMRSLMSRET
jgi:hypothetical protein